MGCVSPCVGFAGGGGSSSFLFDWANVRIGCFRQRAGRFFGGIQQGVSGQSPLGEDGVGRLAGSDEYNAGLFDERLSKMKRALGRRATSAQLVVGINCAGEPREIKRQIEAARRAGCKGFALFAYSHLFENHQATAKGKAVIRCW